MASAAENTGIQETWDTVELFRTTMEVYTLHSLTNRCKSVQVAENNGHSCKASKNVVLLFFWLV